MKYLFEKRLISNGMALSACRTEKFKTCVVKLDIATPATADDEDCALFGLLVNVLKCGTERYPERSDIIKRLGDLYDASCSIGGYATGDNRIFEISAEVLSDRFSEGESILDGVTELMSQMLYHPRLDNNGLFFSDTVEREKRVMIDKIKSEKNNSREYAFKRCREAMGSGEPYGASVKASVLEKITSERLAGYYRQFLAKASPTFSYIGDMEEEGVLAVIERHFGAESIGTADELLPLNCNFSGKVKNLEEELDIKQGILVIGFKTGVLLGDRLSDGMRVFNNIYGGTCTSRLFTNVRERMGLCYYCDSDFVSTKGIMFVSCGIDVSDKELALEEIIHQLDILRNEPVPESELDAAKDMAIKDLREMQDYPGAIASFRYSHEMYGFSSDIDEKINKIRRVTSSDIRDIAEKIKLDTVFFLKGTAKEEDDDE